MTKCVMSASSQLKAFFVSESKHWHTSVKTGKYQMTQAEEMAQHNFLMTTATYFQFFIARFSMTQMDATKKHKICF